MVTIRKENLNAGICFLITLSFFYCCNARETGTNIKPRLIVLTDISSLSQDEGEPDDGQSLLRLMLYTNELDIEGLIATSNLGHGQIVKPELIRMVINAYGKVRPNLILHDPEYPTVTELMNVVFAGQPSASPDSSVFKSIGPRMDTKASEWIIRMADKDDSRPLWIVVWGGAADLAQALWKIKEKRTASQLKKFLSGIRVDAIGDQDAAGPWIKDNFPDLYYITRKRSFRGMYRGGDTTLVNSEWIKKNVKGHGALGDLYVDYAGGDAWTWKLGKVRGTKEGDSPTILSLFSNGLNTPGQRHWGSWGGRFMRSENNHFEDAVDSIGNYGIDLDSSMATVYRWRPAWQADFAGRLDWCIKPYQQANHAPLISPGPELLVTRAGQEVLLNRPKVSDPDGDSLSYKWYFYPEAGTFSGRIPTLSFTEHAASFIAPHVTGKKSLHIIMEVSDSGSPVLVRYKRFIITVDPAK